MSRWVNEFKNHRFQVPWQSIREIAKTLKVPDETVDTDVQELARLNKVIAYLGELLKALDPEMISGNMLNNFADQATQCLAQINEYNVSKNIGNLQNANSSLDNMLSYIRPYVISNQAAAQAAITAFKAYADTVNQQINAIKSKAKDAVTQTKANKTRSDNTLAEIELGKAKIKALETALLIGSEAEKSVKDKINSLLDDASIWHARIDELYKKLAVGNGQEIAISVQIDQLKNKAEKDAKSISDAQENSSDVLEDLETFHVQIFGKANDEGITEGGLKSELEARTAQLDKFREEQKTTYKTLLEEIETLLPGALSAGLSTAYCDLKKSYDKPIRDYSRLFYWALGGILLTGFVSIIHKLAWLDNAHWFDIEFVDVTDPIHLLNNLLYKLPILGAVLWLALFASKRRSEASRLQQEYAHKEALAKSYQSFKQQIDALKSDNQELAKKLLDTAIDAIAFNASTTLDGKHGDKFPIHEVTEKFGEKIGDAVNNAVSAFTTRGK